MEEDGANEQSKEYLWFGGDRANFNVAKAEVKEAVDGLCVFIEAGGEADRIKESFPPKLHHKDCDHA